MDSAIADKRLKNIGATNATSLIDLLVVLLLGGIGIYIALLGLYFDNLFLYIVGLIIAIGTAIKIIAGAGKAINEFIISCIDVKKHIRKKNK